MHARTLVAITVCAHLLVITPPGGIWLIYEHGIQGYKAPAQGCVCLSISCLPLLLYIYLQQPLEQLVHLLSLYATIHKTI